MLSICIPTYNFDCSALITDLFNQIDKQSEAVEIILMDDSSHDDFKEGFNKLDQRLRFFPLVENVGRSKIRNLLAKESKYPYLLFLDGDSSIIRKDFIDRYMKLIFDHSEVEVFCGGSIYADQPESEKETLRWRYSKSRENKSSSFLKAHPYQSFTTNNFIIKNEVFEQIKFDERLREYGHEDTLFGYELKKRKVRIKHIDNPVLNGDLDRNELFIDKTKRGISNLIKILDFLDYDKGFIKTVPLLKTYFQIKLIGLEIFLRWWFKISNKRLEEKFKTGQGNLRLFDFYRLGVVSVLFRNQGKN